MGSVETPVIGRPRPLPRHRRAHHDTDRLHPQLRRAAKPAPRDNRTRYSSLDGSIPAVGAHFKAFRTIDQVVEASRRRTTILSCSVAAALPFFYIVDGVRNSTPSIDSTVATQAGWVTIAYSQADFHASTFLRMRIVYDPAYHLNATPGAKNWLDAKHRSPDWVGLNRLASNLENHGAAYVVLICKAPLHGDFSPVHFSLFLEGPAKLHLPAQISWEDGEPLIQSAFPRGVRGKFRGSSSELQDVQAFDFTVNAAPPCQATRKLAEGPTLLERTGDDVESGFAVAGFDAKDLPQFSRATFAGIPGPRSSLMMPLWVVRQTATPHHRRCPFMPSSRKLDA